ncbi:MAG TPA: LysM peptidoglycan-binding domain-containing protein [Nocardioidaceae bacterium]|nr:LysM peptidoglycan-binding domain-containing protein [Nocardioidaceae bacterium]
MTTRMARALAVPPAAIGLGWLAWWAAEPAASEALRIATGRVPLAAVSVDRAVVDLAGVVALGVLGWFALVLPLILLAALASQAPGWVAVLAHRLAPAPWRRWVLAACGLGMAAPIALAPGATAHDGGAAVPCPRACSSLGGLPFPDLPVAPIHAPGASHRPDRSLDSAAGPGTLLGRGVTVQAGDSLWTIARSRWPAADAHQLTELVEAVYARNRAVIGPDPNLIFPGTTLAIPEGAA